MLLVFHSLTNPSWICLMLHPFPATFYQLKEEQLPKCSRTQGKGKNLSFYFTFEVGEKTIGKLSVELVHN